MAREKLLHIEPQELHFHFELRMQASCTIRLSNCSGEHVAFKVMTTTPEKYFVRPNAGILVPGSICDVKVTMHGPEEVSPDIQCRDKFLIKSVVASPGDTVEQSRKLFNEKKNLVEGCKLRVVYILPPNQRSSNSERSGEGSSLYGSTVQQRGSSDIENGWSAGDLFMKSLTVIFLCLIFWYLLHVIWSLTLMGSVFVIKMGRRLVSDSVEDWIEKTILYLCIHFFTALFRRNKSKPDHDSGASNVG